MQHLFMVKYISSVSLSHLLYHKHGELQLVVVRYTYRNIRMLK